jgi:rod shape-determining protein MreD
MRIHQVILWTFLLVILENSVCPWLIPAEWLDRLLPHLSFIMTLFVAVYAGRYQGFMFGLGFGLLEDLLFYGNLIGPYGFGMGLIGYFAGLATERRKSGIGQFILVVLFGGLLLDTIVYWIYRLFKLTDLPLGYMLYWQVAPTALLQLMIALLMYVPVRRYLVKPSASPGEDGTD